MKDLKMDLFFLDRLELRFLFNFWEIFIFIYFLKVRFNPPVFDNVAHFFRRFIFMGVF